MGGRQRVLIRYRLRAALGCQTRVDRGSIDFGEIGDNSRMRVAIKLMRDELDELWIDLGGEG